MASPERNTIPSSACIACRSAIAVLGGLCLGCYARRVLEERGAEEAREEAEGEEVRSDADD